MKFSEFLTESQFIYFGQCDRLRKCGYEQNWQKMMDDARPVSQQEFLNNVDVSDLLDQNESPEEWLQNFKSPQFLKSFWLNKTCYFIAANGFEFIFIEP